MLNGPNGPVGNFSLIDIAEHQWGYINQLMERLAQSPGTEICRVTTFWMHLKWSA
ncbi:MAG: hypothetical protein R3E54_05835 [Halioglobus sp.]